MTDELRSLYKKLDDSDRYKKENKLLYLKPLPDKPPWPEYRLNKPQTDFMNCYTDEGLIPKRIIAKGANKVCKGQPIDEPVLTPSGWVSIGKLKIGDSIISSNGGITKVIGVINRGIRSIFKLEFDDNSWTRCDEDHLWKVQYYNNRFRGYKKTTNKQFGKWRIVNTHDLINYRNRARSDGKHITIPTTTPIKFKKRKLLFDPYVMGVLLGDGYLGHKKSNKSIFITTKDEEIIQRVINKGYRVRLTQPSQYHYCVYSNIKRNKNGTRAKGWLREILEHYELYGLRSWEKFIPKDYLYSSIGQRLELLRGLNDTDGCARKNSSLVYSTTSEQLAEDIKFIVRSLGGKAKIFSYDNQTYTYKGEKRRGRKIYKIFFTIDFCPFYLTRKVERFRISKKTRNRIIRKIEEIGKEECVCIIVDNPDGLYITRDFIVTHNSHIGAIRGICLSLGEHPFLSDNHPLRYTKGQISVPNIGLVAGEHLTQVVEKKLVPAYLEWIPRITGFSPRKHVKRNSQGVITKIEIPYDLRGNELGSIIYFGHYLDAEAQEGIDFNWVHFDEPPTQKFYTAVVRGLVAYNGVLWMAFTSLKEPFIYDMIAERSIDYGGNDRETRIVEFGKIWVNWEKNGGFLTKQAIEEFIADVPPHERAARVDGEWMRGGERIFGSFVDVEPYVCPDYEIPKHWTWVEGADPHDGKESIWIFLAISPYEVEILGEIANRVFLVDYLRLGANTTLSEMKKEIEIKRAHLGYKEPYMVVIDAKQARRRQKGIEYRDEITWQEKLDSIDIGYLELADQGPDSVEEVGHKIMREYLKPQYSKLFEKEVPGFVIMEKCRGQGGPIEAMLKYRYQRDTNKPEDDEYKDVIDATRYPLMKKPTYVEKYMVDTDSSKVVDKFTGR